MGAGFYTAERGWPQRGEVAWLVEALGDGLAGEVGGGPGGLEVEAAGDAVDVEDFAGEVEAGDEAACHGFEVDVAEVDAATGDELVFVHAFAVDGEGAGTEFLGEAAGEGAREVGPAEFGEVGVERGEGGFDEGFPEAGGDVELGVVEEAFAGGGGAELVEALEDLGFGGAAGPVDEDVEAVVELLEVAGTPGGDF